MHNFFSSGKKRATLLDVIRIFQTSQQFNQEITKKTVAIIISYTHSFWQFAIAIIISNSLPKIVFSFTLSNSILPLHMIYVNSFTLISLRI